MSESEIEKYSDENYIAEPDYSVELNLAAVNQLTESNSQIKLVENSIAKSKQSPLKGKLYCSECGSCDCTHISDTTNETFKDTFTFSDSYEVTIVNININY